MKKPNFDISIKVVNRYQANEETFRILLERIANSSKADKKVIEQWWKGSAPLLMFITDWRTLQTRFLGTNDKLLPHDIDQLLIESRISGARSIQINSSGSVDTCNGLKAGTEKYLSHSFHSSARYYIH